MLLVPSAPMADVLKSDKMRRQRLTTGFAAVQGRRRPLGKVIIGGSALINIQPRREKGRFHAAIVRSFVLEGF